VAEYEDEDNVKVVPHPASLPFIDYRNWDGVPVPDQDWIVRDRLPRRQTALFSGDGAIGKSMTMLYLCSACALGRDWLGTVPEMGPALFIDAEDEEIVIHRRLASIVKHYNASNPTRFADLFNSGLHLLSLAGQDTVLATASRGGKIQSTPLYNQLFQFAGDIKPVVITMASSANFFAGNEINRSEVQQFVGLLTKLAITANGTLVLLSHPSLTGAHTNSGLSGSTAWHASVRARFFMHSIKSDENDDEADTSDIREIVFKKSNYGPLADSMLLQWQDGMFLPKKTKSSLEQAVADAKVDSTFINLLRRFNSEGRLVGHKKGPSCAPAQFADQPEARQAHISSKMFEAGMERLFRAGTVVALQYGRPSRPSYQIAIRSQVSAAHSFRVIGPSDQVCEQCGNGGSTYLIRDPFRGVASHSLHERCAAAFFDREESP
jgi:RecA-family ATPase